MSDIVTVDYLLDILQTLHDNGYGNAKIKCLDNYLYDNEISVWMIGEGEVKLRGYLFNYPPTKRVNELAKDLDKAIRKFYGTIPQDELGE